MKILFVSPTPTHPTNAGNRARILNMCDLLRAQGHEIFFLHVTREKGDVSAMSSYFGVARFRQTPHRCPVRRETSVQKLLRRLRQLVSLDARYRWNADDWYTPATTAACQAWHAESLFDAVIVEYIFLSKAFEAFDASVIRILDTHDRFSDRHRLYLQQGLPPQFFSTSQPEEARALARADWVLAIQEQENAFFRSIGANSVLTVGHLLPLLPPPRAREPGPCRLLFVGSRNPINVEGMQHFLKVIWPRFQSAGHNAELCVAGGVCEALQASTGVRLLGFVENLDALYAQTDVVINPVRTGTGLNIKSVEALAHGRFLLSSPAGARGLESGDAVGVAVVTRDEEWLAALERVTASPEICQQLGQMGWQYAERLNRHAAAGLLALLSTGDSDGDPALKASSSTIAQARPETVRQ